MNVPAAFPSNERWRLRASDFELLHKGGGARRATAGRADRWRHLRQEPADYPGHARIKTRLVAAIGARLAQIGSGLEAIVEVSVIVADNSVSEPDIVVSDYRGDRFMPADTVTLAVEVSTTSLDNDLGRKAELYAAAGILEYWVVDVNDQRIIAHSGPTAGGYSVRSVVPFGEALVSTAVDGLLVDSTILGS